jgi:membrane-bound lytic murein transglycosylase MltF
MTSDKGGVAMAFSNALNRLVLGLIGIACLSMAAPALADSKFLSSHILDLDGMKQRRLIRILVPYSKTIYFIDQGKQYGTAVEFGTALETALNAGAKRELDRVRIAFIPVGRNELIHALNDGLGDVVMANLTITPARLEQVDFTVPVYDKASEILVTGPSAERVVDLDDLSGRQVAVRETSSYFEHLSKLNADLKSRGKTEISIRITDENLEDEDLLEMVNADLLAYTVVDKYKAAIWSSIFKDVVVRPDIEISGNGQIAWAIRKNSPLLKKELDRFVATHRVGTTFGNILKNTYFKSDKILQRAYSSDDVEKFKQLVTLFRKHGTTYSFDYLMLMAQGYQESKLDQSKRSPRGAVGIMQLLPATARDKVVAIAGIDKDEDRNIEAGSKYLRYLMDTYLNEPGLNARERELLAFAAYNAGPGNLKKFRKRAADLGLNPNIWFGNVENSAADIVGRETVQYVGNIYKYYIAYTMLAERLQENADAVSSGKKGG